MDKIKVKIEFYENDKKLNQILDIDKIYRYNYTDKIFINITSNNTNDYIDSQIKSLNDIIKNNDFLIIIYKWIVSNCSIFYKENCYERQIYINESIKFFINDYFLYFKVINFDKNHTNIAHLNIKYNFIYNNKLYNDNIIILLPFEIKNGKYSDRLYTFIDINRFVINQILYQEYLKENNQELITSKQLIDYTQDIKQDIINHTKLLNEAKNKIINGYIIIKNNLKDQFNKIQPQINNLQKEIKFTQDEINKEFKKIENNISSEIFKNYQENIQINKELQKEINILKEEIKQLKQSNNENDNKIKIIQEEVINKLNRYSKEINYNLSILKQDLIKNMYYNKKIQSNKQNYNNYNIIINLLILIMFVCYIYFYHF